MKNSTIIFCFLIVAYTYCYSQDNNANLILSYPEESEISFFQYPERTFVKAIYNSQAEATNVYPEQLLESIISATNQEWVNYNTLGGAEKASQKKQSHFDKIMTMDKDKNYFELAHKLTFDVGGVPTAVTLSQGLRVVYQI
ncbi:hypothetical protein [Zobellia galactanivorans]|uniref:Hypothetical lipoprotein n=1 Tax=Zobellia galactanivorans (strain DSM 12802 / CCUG 47099 / CIP 106680 / NCIMB 13871 / Dsij) TaxID=63186 RepID=G0L3T5_ZOBGA|nr:hypothetical protein [Zobellia galactanivorans]CAZ95449.1 Hypothetical lipoprotein [Zobellia galactanivorans]